MPLHDAGAAAEHGDPMEHDATVCDDTGAMAGKTTKATTRRWRVLEFAKKARYLTTVVAPDAETAIKLAIEEYNITDPHRRRRLVAQPIP
jgi:hypothetical protein